MSLSCTHVTVRHAGNTTDTLTDVSLEVRPGQIVGVTGVSGAGKSTLLRVLAGLLSPSAGTVTVDGTTLSPTPTAQERREHAARVALVRQRPEQQFFAPTVYDEVAFAPRNLELDQHEVDRRIEAALKAVGLDARAIGSTSPFAHSGGEQRRIAIADMIALGSPYLLLDEPTAGLDPAARDHVLHSIQKLALDGRGVIMVSHDRHALDICNGGVFELADGRILRLDMQNGCVRAVAADESAHMAPSISHSNHVEGREKPATSVPGAFRPGASLAHRLHPSAKLVYCLLFMVAGFIARTPVAFVAVGAAVVVSLIASGCTPARALRTLKPFCWLMVFVLLFNACFTASGSVIFTLGPVQLTCGGLVFGALSVLRFAFVLLGTSMLMSTTSPTALADGVERLMRPLHRLGLRTDDVTLAIQLTLRFIPVLLEEFARIKEAQEMRLAQFDAASSLARARSFVPVIVPLFSSALRRSDTLALAMVNREYGQYRCARTCIRSYRFGAAEVSVLATGVVLLALALA